MVRSGPAARVRHVRKKNSLPLSVAASTGKKERSGSRPSPPGSLQLPVNQKKPVLSYRISAKELADALDRDRRRRHCCEGGGIESEICDVDDEDDEDEEERQLGDELFRDALLTDSSANRSCLSPDGSFSSVSSSSIQTTDEQLLTSSCTEDGSRTWRSPEEERQRRRILEQRKEQWRAAKAAVAERITQTSASFNSLRPDRVSATDLSVQPEHHLLRVPNVLRHAGSDRQISRCNSLRCPTSTTTLPSPMPVEPNFVPLLATTSPSPPPVQLIVPVALHEPKPRPAIFQPPPPPSSSPTPPPLTASPREFRSASPCPARVLRKARDSPVDDIPWQFRRFGNQSTTTQARSTVTKFGHHVGPARNPDCRCVHCVDHFTRLRSPRTAPIGC